MLTNNKGIIACAGAGKTYTICKEALKSNSASLLITYTNKGKEAINNQIAEINDGVPSKKVSVETWFEFLLNEIIRPYQSAFLRLQSHKKTAPLEFFQTIDFSTTHHVNYKRKGTLEYYYAGNHKLKHNETVVLADELLSIESDKVITRLYQQYKTIYFDEIQDLIGTDMDLLKKLIDSPISVVMVGDPKQFTFSTHTAKKNIKVSGKNINNFFKELEKVKKLKIEYKQTTRRFGPELAELANEIDPSGELLLGSSEVKREYHVGIYLITKKQIAEYYKKIKPQVLVFNKSAAKKLPNDFKYLNFGNSKGMTFDDTIIVPPKPLKDLFEKNKKISSPAKYYIAATRARFSIAFLVTNPAKYQAIHPNWKIWNAQK